MEWLRFICFFVLTALAVSAAAEPAKPVWKEHPYLFIERSEVPQVLARAEKYAWAKKALENVRKSADKWMEKKLEFPPSTGRHSVTYVCKTCMEPLKTLSPTQHQCPKCGKIYSGLPYDARLYTAQHDALAKAASNLGLAALLFDDPKYARKALDILLGYADRYAGYPLIDNRGGQSASAAKIFDQTLNEAIWLIDISWAYDLVLGAKVGTPEEHKKVEENLLRPSVETIKRYRAKLSNWQTWHNAGMLAAALAMRDEALVNQVLNDPECGVYFQMKNSILEDGAWYEGTWSYHFYSVSALLKTAEAAYRSGIDLYTLELKKALEIPLKCVMPNGRLPAINDGVDSGLPAWHYEIASARYGDPVFQDVIAGGNRGGVEALLVGIDRPKKHPEAPSSAILNASGLAILRRGEQYITLDFGPHGGGHGHLDKLAVNYYTAGRVFAPDPGRGWPYNLPIHREYYRRTLSHNTVVVDETPQAQCTGLLESHDFDGDCDIVAARADDAYEGVKMRRILVLGDTWLLDVFEVESNKPHVYDWIWHARGDFDTGLANKPAELKTADASYKYLSKVRTGSGGSDWRAAWTMPNGKVYALFKGSTGRTTYLCDAPDNPKTDTLHSVILRESARKCRFVALFSLDKQMEWTDLPEKAAKLVSDPEDSLLVASHIDDYR